MKRLNKFLVFLALASTLTLAPINASRAVEASEIGYITGSVFTSLIYTPIKGAYALIVGLTGGLSLMATVPAGVPENSINIVKLGVGGDWWIAPEHLRGEQPVQFVGSLDNNGQNSYKNEDGYRDTETQIDY